MIHSHTISQLSEEEYMLLFSVSEHIFNRIGLHTSHQWVKMLRVDQVVPLLNNIANLKEEYHPVRESLVSKLQQGVF